MTNIIAIAPAIKRKRGIARLRYALLFILINIVSGVIVTQAVETDSGFLMLIATIVWHYLIITLNCFRLRDSGFSYIKSYISVTLLIYLYAIVEIGIEGFDCGGTGISVFLGWYFLTFVILMMAPTAS
ncbi:hypothetical protein [Intestinirhabdus alba]|uniref:Transporter n=1 Tax=Intestinirhabdus alba TaxID=2899544 RepID=A0A6L6INW1_9ENTR|nr:hypothetical protein [Intestinirhabdus alba]MTH47597.1 hypothetical protein [Intestinirhabdus alba]